MDVDEIDLHRLADDGGPHALPDHDPKPDAEPDQVVHHGGPLPPKHSLFWDAWALGGVLLELGSTALLKLCGG